MTALNGRRIKETASFFLCRYNQRIGAAVFPGKQKLFRNCIVVRFFPSFFPFSVLPPLDGPKSLLREWLSFFVFFLASPMFARAMSGSGRRVVSSFPSNSYVVFLRFLPSGWKLRASARGKIGREKRGLLLPAPKPKKTAKKGSRENDDKAAIRLLAQVCVRVSVWVWIATNMCMQWGRSIIS